jgi:L-alanine-DL-glutamate epimerase-like enolase superfamily enzyme
MTINEENTETCNVVAQYLGKALIGISPLDVEAYSALLDSIIYGNSSIKSVFDFALYDITSQHAELPLYAFWGGKNNKTLKTGHILCLGPIDKMIRDAIKIIDSGFQFVKVKLAGQKEEEIRLIQHLHAKCLITN